MRCDQCGGPTHVIETRVAESETTRRRRECKTCGHRFNSFEVHELGFHPNQAASASRAAARRIARWWLEVNASQRNLTPRQFTKEVKSVDESNARIALKRGWQRREQMRLFQQSKK